MLCMMITNHIPNFKTIEYVLAELLAFNYSRWPPVIFTILLILKSALGTCMKFGTHTADTYAIWGSK